MSCCWGKRGAYPAACSTTHGVPWLGVLLCCNMAEDQGSRWAGNVLESGGLHACPKVSDESQWLGPAVLEGLLLKGPSSLLPYVGL